MNATLVPDTLQAPPIDAQVPALVETATFALG